jgi:hypothetical protein
MDQAHLGCKSTASIEPACLPAVRQLFYQSRRGAKWIVKLLRWPRHVCTTSVVLRSVCSDLPTCTQARCSLQLKHGIAFNTGQLYHCGWQPDGCVFVCMWSRTQLPSYSARYALRVSEIMALYNSNPVPVPRIIVVLRN